MTFAGSVSAGPASRTPQSALDGDGTPRLQVALREIAGRMFLAEKTVKNYVPSLLAKFGLERRTQAAVLPTRLLGDHPR